MLYTMLIDYRTLIGAKLIKRPYFEEHYVFTFLEHLTPNRAQIQRCLFYNSVYFKIGKITTIPSM